MTIHVPVVLAAQQTTAQPDMQTEIWQAQHDGLIYQVSVVTPAKSGEGQPPTGLYDDILNGMRVRVKDGRFAGTRTIVVGAHSGRQTRITGTDVNVVAQIILTNGRIYIAAVYGAQLPDWDAPEVRQFMESLRITG